MVTVLPSVPREIAEPNSFSSARARDRDIFDCRSVLRRAAISRPARGWGEVVEEQANLPVEGADDRVNLAQQRHLTAHGREYAARANASHPALATA